MRTMNIVVGVTRVQLEGTTMRVNGRRLSREESLQLSEALHNQRIGADLNSAEEKAAAAKGTAAQ